MRTTTWITFLGLGIAGLLMGCEGSSVSDCFDGSDNDGDGAFDCMDSGCAAYCTGGGGDEDCEPGEQQTCSCGGAAYGVQFCDDDGEGWGSCECDDPGDDDAGDDDAGDDDAGDDDAGDDDAGDDDAGDDDAGDDDADPVEAIAGSWISTESVGGYYGEMDFTPTLHGSGILYFYAEEELYYADFDISVSAYVSDIHYDVWFDCDGAPELDFTFSCGMPYTDRLECIGDGLWANYAMDFDRN